MENDNDLKNLWQQNIDNTIRPYQDSVLQQIVIRSVRKSTIKPLPWFSILLCPFIFYYFIRKIIEGNQTFLMDIFQIGIMVFISGLVFWLIIKYKRTSKYSPDKTLREWIGEKIKKMREQIFFLEKYRYYLFIFTTIFALGVAFTYQYLSETPIGMKSVVIIISIVTLYTFIAVILRYKRYRKEYQNLKKLYDELEEL